VPCPLRTAPTADLLGRAVKTGKAGAAPVGLIGALVRGGTPADGCASILQVVKIIFGAGLVRRRVSECENCRRWLPGRCWPRRTRSAPAGERPLRDVPHETQFRGDLPARARRILRGRLHDAAAAGLIQGFAHCYFGMPDARLAVPVADLVPAEDVRGYPTSFRAMSESDLNAISLRGEQLTRTLLAHYCPAL
jgi:hypothetical protein